MYNEEGGTRTGLIYSKTIPTTFTYVVHKGDKGTKIEMQAKKKKRTAYSVKQIIVGSIHVGYKRHSQT